MNAACYDYFSLLFIIALSSLLGPVHVEMPVTSGVWQTGKVSDRGLPFLLA